MYRRSNKANLKRSKIIYIQEVNSKHVLNIHFLSFNLPLRNDQFITRNQNEIKLCN